MKYLSANSLKFASTNKIDTENCPDFQGLQTIISTQDEVLARLITCINLNPDNSCTKTGQNCTCLQTDDLTPISTKIINMGDIISIISKEVKSTQSIEDFRQNIQTIVQKILKAIQDAENDIKTFFPKTTPTHCIKNRTFQKHFKKT